MGQRTSGEVYELHTADRAGPVGYVTATRVIRDPAELEDLRRAATAGGATLFGGVTAQGGGPACGHVHRERVELLVWPHEHVADICTDCLEALPLLGAGTGLFGASACTWDAVKAAKRRDGPDGHR